MGLPVIITLLLNSPVNTANAQQQLFKNFTINDGLVSNSIRKIFQDSKGFIWIGTMEGVSRYDGNSFTNFTTNNGLTHSLVNDICETSDKRLFVALNNGDIDEIKDDRIIGAQRNKITINRFFHLPHKGILGLTDDNGFQVFKNGKLSKPTQTMPGATFYNAVILSDTTFLAYDNTTLKLFNNNLDYLKERKISNNIYSKIAGFKDSKDRIWIASDTGINMIPADKDLFLFTWSQAKKTPWPLLNHLFINDILEDQAGNLWVATSTGIVKVSPDGSNQVYTVEDGLASNIVNLIFQDREQNLWFGTTSGISKMVTKSDIKFYPIENGVRTNDLQYLMYPFRKGHFLVSTVQGTMDFNKTTGTFTPAFKINEGFFSYVVLNSDPLMLSGDFKSITFDTLDMRPKVIPSLSEPSPIRIIAKDKNGYGFSGNLEGLFFNSTKGPVKLINSRIAKVILDDSTLWAGTWENGLVRIQYKVIDDDIQIIEKRYFFPGLNVRALFEDTKGNIWVGSRYDGVYRIEQTENNNFKVLHLNERNGLTSDYIKSIKEDAKGNVWIGFFQGLDKLIPRGNAFQIFNFSRINNFFTSIAGIEIDEDNLIWLATAEGIVRIKDGGLEKLTPFPVYITKIFSSDSTYPLDSKNVTLNYSQKDLLFEFSSPSYINEKQVFYSYRLAGNNNGPWSAPSNRHFISYSGLPAGSYSFQVKSLGWNGHWGPPAIVNFRITPPFWKTNWFNVIGILLIILITGFFVRQRIKVVRRESELKRNIVETEMMALRAQMNPHFIFNCINSIDALIQENDKYHATMYLNKFAKLIRNILDSSRQNTVFLVNDLDTLRLYIELEQFRYEDKFITEVKVDEDLLQDDYKVPPLIVQPFVENAIQHGLRNRPDNNGKLSIYVEKKQHFVQYIIEDNGVGRQEKATDDQEKKTSYGISMSSERVRLFNKEEHASVKITDIGTADKPLGTRVEVRLNIQSC